MQIINSINKLTDKESKNSVEEYFVKLEALSVNPNPVDLLQILINKLIKWSSPIPKKKETLNFHVFNEIASCRTKADLVNIRFNLKNKKFLEMQLKTVFHIVNSVLYVFVNKKMAFS